MSTATSGTSTGASVAVPEASRARTTVALASLVGMAMLWGSTFFSTKGLTGRMPVADLLAVRFALMTVLMGLVGWRAWRMTRSTLLHGLAIGGIYGIAQLVQTVGLAMTAASSSGFITGLYVVFTPFLAARLLRERVPGSTWLAVVLATLGLGVLTIDPSHGFHVGTGELLTLVGAVLYSCHIVAVDHWTSAEESASITLVQVATITAVTGVFALPGGIALPHGGDWWLMLYLALVAGAIPIFLQVWAQSVVDSTTAAVLMAGEPVWAAVFAVLLGGEHVTWQMLCGGGAMVGAMMLVTLLPRLRRRSAP